MYKRITISLMLLLVLVKFSSAQSTQSTNVSTVNSEEYQYYIYISGITSKEQVKVLESDVQRKSGVTYFLGNRYPVRYFLLKSKKEISQITFAEWIGTKYKLEYYTEGEYGKEGALMTGIKLRKGAQKINIK